MTPRKINYLVSNGLGNIVQTLPAYSYLRSVYGADTVQVCATQHYFEFAKVVYPDVKLFDNAGCRWDFKNANPNAFTRNGGASEVKENLNLVGCTSLHGYPKFAATRLRINYGTVPKYDVLICNGYNKRYNTKDWYVKTYPYWRGVAEELQQRQGDLFSVASIGLPDEYIEDTHNETGTDLQRMFALIQNAKLVLSNDTGAYHIACALGIPCIVVFTMTDTDKNYDPVFHRSALQIARYDLPCRPCQYSTLKHFWLKNQPICKWACRGIDTQKIIVEAERILHG